MSTTLIIPCYNEADRLDVDAFLRFGDRDVHFRFVDDGSTDGTRAILEDLVPRLPDASLLCLVANAGKGEAVRAGILSGLEAGPRYVGYWDADLATPLSAVTEFREVLNARPEVAAAFGSRVRLLGRTIERRPARHYAGRIFATFTSLMLGLPIYDTQCGAKLLRVDEATRELFVAPFLSRWLFDVEVVARMILASRREGRPPAICEIPLREWRDVRGSKLRLSDTLRAPYELSLIYDAYLRRS